MGAVILTAKEQKLLKSTDSYFKKWKNIMKKWFKIGEVLMKNLANSEANILTLSYTALISDRIEPRI